MNIDSSLQIGCCTDIDCRVSSPTKQTSFILQKILKALKFFFYIHFTEVIIKSRIAENTLKVWAFKKYNTKNAILFIHNFKLSNKYITKIQFYLNQYLFVLQRHTLAQSTKALSVYQIGIILAPVYVVF